MSLSTSAINTAVNAVGTAIDTIKLHSGDPGAAGTANDLGLSESCSYSAAAGGTASLSANVVFSGISSGTTVSHFSLWDGATYMGSGDVTDITFAATGTATITQADITIS